VNNRIKVISSETIDPRLHYCHWQHIRSSTCFRTVLSESQNTQTHDIMPISIQTFLYVKWPINVIQVHLSVSEKPRRDTCYSIIIVAWYIKIPKIIASERSKNRHFRTPHFHLAPLSSEAPRISAWTYCHKIGSLGHFSAADSIMPIYVGLQCTSADLSRSFSRSLNNFARKPEHANSLDAQPKTDFNAK